MAWESFTEVNIPNKTYQLSPKRDGFPKIYPYFRTAKISTVVIESIALFFSLFRYMWLVSCLVFAKFRHILGPPSSVVAI